MACHTVTVVITAAKLHCPELKITSKTQWSNCVGT